MKNKLSDSAMRTYVASIKFTMQAFASAVRVFVNNPTSAIISEDLQYVVDKLGAYDYEGLSYQLEHAPTRSAVILQDLLEEIEILPAYVGGGDEPDTSPFSTMVDDIDSVCDTLKLLQQAVCNV